MAKYKNIIVPTLTLTIISVLVAVLLAVTYQATGVGNIQPGLSDEECAEFAGKVIPGASKLAQVPYESENADLLGVYKNENGDELALLVQAVGYAGKDTPVQILVGFDQEGVTTGVAIVSSGETPGLGTKIEDEEYLQQYVGLSGSADGVDTITGATFSSTALRDGVNLAMSEFEAVKEEVSA